MDLLYHWIQSCSHHLEATDVSLGQYVACCTKKDLRSCPGRLRPLASLGSRGHPFEFLLLSSYSVVSSSFRSHGPQHTRFTCPSPSPGVCSNLCPLSQWCQPTIWSSVIPFSCLQSFPASGSFPMSQLFASDGQSIGASASVLPVNIQGWFPLGLTCLISLQSKGLSRVFPNTTVRKHHFFSIQLSL